VIKQWCTAQECRTKKNPGCEARVESTFLRRVEETAEIVEAVPATGALQATIND
jgi:hypothetical protein